MDLSVAVEMSKEENAKANLCQKLVKVQKPPFSAFYFSDNFKGEKIQFYSKSFLQVLTYQLLGQVEKAQMWKDKLKS